MSSPFMQAASKARSRTPLDYKEPAQSALNNPLTQSPVFAPSVIKEVGKPALMTIEQVEQTGAAAGRNLKSVSAQVLRHQRANNGDEMTERLNALVKQAKQLDPNSMKNSKGLRKFFKRLMGLKEDIFEQFDTVEGRIDVLTKELLEDLKREKEGLFQLENLKKGVAEYALSLDRDVQLLQNNYAKEQEVYQALPEDEVELRQERLALLDLMETRINDLSALRLLMVQMGPRLKGMEDVGRQLIRAGDNVINTVIPAYSANFSAYIHSLRQAKSAEALTATLDEFNTAIAIGGQLASENQIKAARLANRQVLSIETLKKDQELLLTTLEEVNKINTDARQERIGYITEVGNLEQGMIDKIRQGLSAK